MKLSSSCCSFNNKQEISSEFCSGVWQRQKCLHSFHISPHHHLHLHHDPPVKHNTNKLSLWHTLTDNLHITDPHLTQEINNLTAPECTITYCYLYIYIYIYIYMNLNVPSALSQILNKQRAPIPLTWPHGEADINIMLCRVVQQVAAAMSCGFTEKRRWIGSGWVRRHSQHRFSIHQWDLEVQSSMLANVRFKGYSVQFALNTLLQGYLKHTHSNYCVLNDKIATKMKKRKYSAQQ